MNPNHPTTHLPIFLLLFLGLSCFPRPQTAQVIITPVTQQIAQVETAIPAFIGHTEKTGQGWLTPQKISSMAEYEQHFGAPQPEANLGITISETQDARGRTTHLDITTEFAGPRSKHLMYYSLESYFANGGGACYIVPVSGYLGLGEDLSPGDPRRKTAFFGGLAEVEKIDEVTLLVIPEIQGMAGIEDMRALYDAALDQSARLQDRFVIMDLYRHDAQSDILAEAESFRQEGIGNQNLKWGAVYGPNLETTHAYVFSGSTPVSHKINNKLGAKAEKIQLEELAERHPALYSKVEGKLRRIPCILPAAPAAAGVYAKVDRTQGVWKAPANVSLQDVLQPILSINSSQQEDLNVDPVAGKSVNAIRQFSGKGTLIWGARTLAGNDNEWRYVPVRRFYNMLEESIKKGTTWVVFEPNDEPLWTQVKGQVETFLQGYWQYGAIQGATPSKAYYARVGLGQTMTAQDIQDGKTIIELGFAPLRPAEFVVLKIVHIRQ